MSSGLTLAWSSFLSSELLQSEWWDICLLGVGGLDCYGFCVSIVLTVTGILSLSVSLAIFNFAH